MNFKDYVATSERTYQYLLRTVVQLDDDAMDYIERVLLKYQPVDISRPRKLMLQDSPLDFTQFTGAEVNVVEIELGLPASSYVLANELVLALGCHKSEVIVRGYNDPSEVEADRLVANGEMDKEAAEAGKTPAALLADPEYSEGQETPELYGDAYNAKFLGYLRKVQKEREEKSKVDATNPLFSWMDMPKGEADDNGAFNAGIEGAPKIGDPSAEAPAETSNQGNLTDRKRSYKRLYGKGGERTVSTREVDTAKGAK